MDPKHLALDGKLVNITVSLLNAMRLFYYCLSLLLLFPDAQ